MNFVNLPLSGAFLIELDPFEDERGIFTKIFNQKLFNVSIKEVNHSITHKRGTVRGMHYQVAPYGETKIVKCIRGAVHDVMIEVISGRYYSHMLHAHDNCMLLIPEGFAHGFQALTNNVELLYFSPQHYQPGHERGINPDVLDWPIPVTLISEKDKSL